MNLINKSLVSLSVNKTGQAIADVNEPRDSHYVSPDGSLDGDRVRSLLLELNRVNELNNNQTFEGGWTGWADYSGHVTTRDTAAPDPLGGNRACRFTTSTVGSSVIKTYAPWTKAVPQSGTWLAAHAWVRAFGRPIKMHSNMGAKTLVVFPEDGWVHYKWVAEGAGSGHPQIQIRSMNDAGTAESSSGTIDASVYNPMMEYGKEHTSYVPGGVTRYVENMDMLGFSRDASLTTTVYSKYIETSNPGSDLGRNITCLGDNLTDNVWILFNYWRTQILVTMRRSGALATHAVNVTPPAYGTVIECLAILLPDGSVSYALAYDGVLQVAGTTPVLQSMTGATFNGIRLRTGPYGPYAPVSRPHLRHDIYDGAVTLSEARASAGDLASYYPGAPGWTFARNSIAYYEREHGIETTTELNISEDNLDKKTQELEVAAQEYTYGDMSLAFSGVPLSFFNTYDIEDRAYLIDMADENDNSYFFGYLQPESIKKNLPEEKFSARLLSIEKLLEASPNINPRGEYETRLVLMGPESGGAQYTLGSLSYEGPPLKTGAPTGRLYRDQVVVRFYMESDAAFDKYREPGCVIHSSMGHAADGGSIDLKLHITSVSTISVQSGVGLYEAKTNYMSSENMYDLSGDGEIVGSVLYNGDNTCYLYAKMPKLASNPEAFDTEGKARKPHLAVYDPANSREYRFSVIKVEYVVQTVGGVDDEYVRVHFNDEAALVENNLGSGWFSSTWDYWLMPTIPSVYGENTTAAAIYTKDMYGVSQKDEDLTGNAWGDYFEVKDLIEGMLNTVPYLEQLECEVDIFDTDQGSLPELRLSSMFTLSPRPEIALNEIQKAADCLIKVEYTQGRGSRGLPIPVFKVYSRNYLAAQNVPVDLDIPISWEEDVQGRRPTIVVKGPAGVNRWAKNKESYGWYSEDRNGLPNYSQGVYQLPRGAGVVEVEVSNIAVYDESYFKDEFTEFYYNNEQLREIAKNIYLTFGRYFRKVRATFRGEAMLSGNFVAQLVREPHQDITGICIAQDSDYRRRTTTLTILLDSQ